ncbi:MAG: HD-GYP domain-containing protein [Candidatus Cloacimonetes bacterium]|nr:HD-GYP domain-containing protein [Candidatus Cloacimonadota bacterium]MCF7814514.1 HD-GYP domain-containing protein [Candidatus Cloacimonadota bacterium]MCF7869051.1 HD-GYP domain-containing protein [Candidatus Cloacimonadota bacterium]MCF7884446.1 HD-GYP domain-containing protein [Candidatus Cloacimonadota bacterium]
MKLNDILLKKSEEKLKNFNETLQLMVAEKTQELLESEKKYKTLYELHEEVLEKSPAGIIRLDKNMRIIYLNPEIIKQLEIRSKSIESLNGDLLKNIPKIDSSGLLQLTDELKSGLEIATELEILNNKKEAKHLEVKGVPIFDNGLFSGAVMLFNDITESIEAEEKMKRSFEMLQKATGDIIQAMSNTSEMRDPYTAGHQKRVKELAVAIGREMKVDKDKLEGLKFAGIIHDIGKISVPSDILSKPGKINIMEFEVIKNHSQVGYDLLSTIEFPWPISTIVHQHHERMDGSGYPNGLKGDEILVESRILAVADVVEAMTSHRPYRAALGTEKALEEIKAHTTDYYDPDVVKACVRLFEEGKFEFTD